MSILINAANLHVGGGVAVASSFICDLSRTEEAGHIVVIASTAVHKNLSLLDAALDKFQSYKNLDIKGISGLVRPLPVQLSSFDIVFTIFGPLYTFSKINRAITGFAQPSVAYPHNLYYDQLSFFKRLVIRFRSEIKAYFFSRSNELIVEAEHICTALKDRPRFRRIPTHVVSSAVDLVYFQREKWRPVNLPYSTAKYRFGVVARNYPHKNLVIFPHVKEILLKKFGMQCDFFVTLTAKEWGVCSKQFKDSVKNVGSLTLPQCPDFNRQLNGVVFPSLLECFSATPIEALASGVPLFASDLPFIKETVGGLGVFFDPLNAEDIASKIYSYFNEWTEENRIILIKKGKDFIKNNFNTNLRTEAYLKIIYSKI